MTLNLLFKHRLIVLLSSILTFNMMSAKASHLAGAEITYKCTTTPGIFEVTLVVYRQCDGGIELCPGTCGSICTMGVSITGADPGFTTTSFGSFVLSLQQVRDINTDVYTRCPSAKSICTNMGCVIPGTMQQAIERYEFKGNVNIGPTSGIPAACCNISLSVSLGARTSQISNVAFNTNLYTEAIINRCISTTPCNSSPVFTIDPFEKTCSVPTVFNYGAQDPDHDSLTFSFAPALSAAYTPLSYVPPYSYYAPLPWSGSLTGPFPSGISCDPSTGDIKFTPSNNSGSNFFGVVVLEIKQWKTVNGVPTVIGKTFREMTVAVLANCANNTPPKLTTNGVYPAITQWEACEGKPLCFDIVAEDIDISLPSISDSTYLSWDSTLAALGATFTPNYTPANRNKPAPTGGPRQDSMKFCWTPPAGAASNTPYLFYVKGSDSRCPNPGRTRQGFSIKVNAIPDADIIKTDKKCGKWQVGLINHRPNQPFTVSQFQVAKKPFDFTFANGSFIYSNVTATPEITFDKGGKYLIKVMLQYGTCAREIYDTINVDTPMQITLSDTIACGGKIISIKPVVSGGFRPFTYRWYHSIRDTALSPINAPLYNDPDLTLTVAASKRYTLQVRDILGCKVYDSVLVSPTNNLKEAVVTHVTCNGLQNGKILLRAKDSLQQYAYQLNSGTFQPTNLFANLLAGNYSVSLKDTTGCVNTLTNLTINQPAPLHDTLVLISNETCKNALNGSFGLSAAGGNEPYSYSIDSINFSSVNFFPNLPPAIYTVHILDTNKCYTSVTRTVAPADTFRYNNIVSDPSCSGLSNGQINMHLAGGRRPYNFRINTGAFSPDSIFKNLSSGTYTISVLDMNGCSDKKTFNLHNPPPVAGNIALTDPSCNNRSDGKIVVSATSGIPPFTYNIDSGLYTSSAVFSQLPAKSFLLGIKDSSGCIVSLQATLNAPAPIIVGGISGATSVSIHTVETYSTTPQPGLHYYWAAQKGSIISGNIDSPAVNVKWDSTGNGLIGVVVYRDTTCGDTTSMSVSIGSSGVNKIAAQMGLDIYPNPVKQQLFIRLNSFPEHKMIYLYDLQGKLLFQQPSKNFQEIDTQNLPAGIYMLRIGDWNGKIIKM